MSFCSSRYPKQRSVYSIQPWLLGVDATVRVGSRLESSGNANAVRVPSRVGHASICPDRPSAVNAVGAGNQVVAGELEVSILGCPALTLGVLGSGLSTSGVSDLTLACSVMISRIQQGGWFKILPIPERST